MCSFQTFPLKLKWGIPVWNFFSDLRFSLGFLNLQGKTAHHFLPSKGPTQTQTTKPVWNFWNGFEGGGGGSGNYTIAVICKKKRKNVFEEKLFWEKNIFSKNFSSNFTKAGGNSWGTNYLLLSDINYFVNCLCYSLILFSLKKKTWNFLKNFGQTICR